MIPRPIPRARRESPRVTAARLAPLREGHAAFFSGAYKAAAAKMEAAMKDAATGMQWVWVAVEKRAGAAAAAVNIDALDWKVV